MNPLNRHYIREKNIKNLDIREKYFDGDFNVF